MVFSGKPLISMPPWRSVFGPAVTLTFDPLISRSNQFIANCNDVANFVKFTQAVYKILC